MFTWGPGPGHFKGEEFRVEFRCGGSLAALQTTEAVVPGSNPSSFTSNNSEDKQSIL